MFTVFFLKFSTLQLEAHRDCVYDRLEIYDSALVDPSLLISRLCGQVNPRQKDNFDG